MNEQPRSLSEPEADQQNQDKRGQTEPGDRNDLDPDLARGRNVVVDVRIAVKESVTIAKDVGAASQIDEEEECRGDSKSRKSCRIDQCQYIIYRRDHFRPVAIQVCLSRAELEPCERLPVCGTIQSGRSFPDRFQAAFPR
jgi:hypothetical protein